MIKNNPYIKYFSLTGYVITLVIIATSNIFFLYKIKEGLLEISKMNAVSNAENIGYRVNRSVKELFQSEDLSFDMNKYILLGQRINSDFYGLKIERLNLYGLDGEIIFTTPADDGKKTEIDIKGITDKTEIITKLDTNDRVIRTFIPAKTVKLFDLFAENNHGVIDLIEVVQDASELMFQIDKSKKTIELISVIMAGIFLGIFLLLSKRTDMIVRGKN